MLVKLYRKLLPFKIRSYLYEVLVKHLLFLFRNFRIIIKSKYICLFQFVLPKNETNKVYAFMGRYGITSYPYKYMLEYRKLKINVEFDAENNLPFVNHNSRKLYFPSFYTTEKVIVDYTNLLIEQDKRSAHRYVRDYSELKGKTLLDIGSAEGIFSLDTIDLVDHLYLFECERFWIEALEKTFSPWKDKVTIVPKFVGDKTSGLFTSLDDFLPVELHNKLFLKMDIEGSEMMAILGAEKILKNGNNINLAICTYHRPNDPTLISDYFNSLGYQTEFSEGLMYWNRRLSKGVLRCSKN